MSFFTTSTGDNLAQNQTGNFTMGGDDFAPIPKDTRVLVIVEEAKISEYQGDRYINIKWDIAQPKEFKGRKIFQKIKVFDTDPSKRDKALRMLAAIDANAGGKLAAAGVEPTDQSLSSALSAKMMVLKLGVWDMNGKTGNWVQEVSKHNGAAAAAKPVAKPAPVQQATAVEDDDIPFANPLRMSSALHLAI